VQRKAKHQARPVSGGVNASIITHRGSARSAPSDTGLRMISSRPGCGLNVPDQKICALRSHAFAKNVSYANENSHAIRAPRRAAPVLHWAER
jgi:hypothetical protein